MTTNRGTITVYCDEAGSEKDDHYTIAAIILPDAQVNIFNYEINNLKKKHFPNIVQEEVIFHATHIQGRRGIFRIFQDERKYIAFRNDLLKLILNKLNPKIACLYFTKKDLSELRRLEVIKPILKNARKPSVYGIGYFQMIIKLNHYFREKGLEWKIMAEKGNNNFIDLVDYFQNNRDNFAFDLAGNLERNLRGKHCLIDKEENSAQIADLVAYTVNEFHKCFKFRKVSQGDIDLIEAEFTRDMYEWEQNRLLPYETLKDLFIWDELDAWRVS